MSVDYRHVLVNNCYSEITFNEQSCAFEPFVQTIAILLRVETTPKALQYEKRNGYLLGTASS